MQFSQKTDCNTNICEVEIKTATDHDCDKNITTLEWNKLTSESFIEWLAQANLVLIS